MAKANSGTSTSEHIRNALNENPGMTGKEIVSVLAKKGIRAKLGLVYYVKARSKAKKRRGQQRNAVAGVVGSNGSLDALSVIKKVKGLAVEVGGMSKLKALVEALG